MRSCFFLLGASQGFPSSTSHLFLHATACRLRRISTPSPFRVLLCCLRWAIKPSASAKTKSRSCTSTSGCATTPAAYRILCLRLTCFVRDSALRHRSKTRYGWVASPCPTGTYTPQDTPSFARRDNVKAQGRAACGASIGAHGGLQHLYYLVSNITSAVASAERTAANKVNQ